MMRLSAHTGVRGLLDVADEIGPQEIMLVHGVPHTAGRASGRFSGCAATPPGRSVSGSEPDRFWG
jgi:hypothetical protein